VIIDSSAIVAIVRDEPDAAALTETMLRAGRLRMSAATYLETSIVVEARRDPVTARVVDNILSRFGVEFEAFTPEHAEIARAAYRDFGKGSGHPARLNFGDCISYALATATGEPLLYKGDDFTHTDIRSALD
jgi:ribonuclease VapC